MFQFNAEQVTPSTGGAVLIPAGDYTVVTDESSLVPVKATPNIMQIKARFSVVEGEFAGTKLYSYFGIYNPDTVKAGYAQADLSALCHATGVMQPQGNALEQLHGIPLTVTVAVSPPKGSYGESNNIKKYAKAGGGAIPQVQQPIAGAVAQTAQALPQQPAAVQQQVPAQTLQQPVATPQAQAIPQAQQPAAVLPPAGAAPLTATPAWSVPPAT